VQLNDSKDKTDRYAEQIGVSPTGVSVRNFKSRWGSCDKQGQVVFNWNIIKAPHLVHPNHSKDFWSFVERFDPAYQEHRDWLKEKGGQLLT
jgi:predicted metal-dependent hydrolase